MEVILLERIRNLGKLGDVVKVKSGFGRNFLVPSGKAIYATKNNLEQFEVRRAALEKVEKEHLDAANERKRKLESLPTLTLKGKAGEEGRLFGSIGTKDISHAFHDAGVDVAKSEIDLPNGPLRQVGEHEIVIELHSDVKATVNVNVVAEE